MSKKKLAVINSELNKEQIKAVETDGEVIVSASAGSGKTRTLIHRILAEIARGTSLRMILVLAYNNAAGEELRERLSNALYYQLMEGGKYEKEFRQAIEDMPFANIGTAHSFCASTIRQNFDSLDISPTFEILSEDAEEILMNNALDNVFEQYLREQDPVFLEFGDIFSFSRGDDDFRDTIKRLYEIIDIRPDRTSFYKTVADCYSKKPFTSPFAKVIKKIYVDSLLKIKEQVAICQNNINFLGKNADYQDILDVYGDILIYINTCKHSNLKNILEATKGLDKLTTRSNREKDEMRTQLKIVISDFKDLVDKFLASMADSDYFDVGQKQNKIYINKLLEIVNKFEIEFKALKDQMNVLTYNDLEHKMVELLNIKEDEIKAEFDAIFVDEYQDTNPTREYIFSHLINDTAFFVGDVKQSIYEFNLADPKLFLERQKKYAKNKKAIQFRKNYRSCEDILNFVNDVFTSIMTKKTADIDYKKGHDFKTKSKKLGDSAQLHFFLEPQEVNSTEKVDVYSIVNHQQKEKYESAAETEGRFIADTILDYIGKKKKDGSEYRFEDFAILFRKRTAATKILSVLRSRNIPLDIGSFNDSESKPENDLIAMLAVIDNPRQDIMLVSFMQSILGGYSKDELLEIEQFRGSLTTNYYDALLAMKDLDTPLALKVQKTLDTIDNFRLRASFKTVSELLRDIISEFAYDAYLMQRGDSDVAEIEAYITAVESIEENNSLSKFMSVYGKRKSSEDKGGTFGGNRVRVSTYHGFKGLEVPIVFLPELQKANSSTKTSPVSAYGNGYLAMDYYDSANKQTHKTISRYAIELLTKQAEEKSEMRLLYVALTRAQEKMYLLANIGTYKKLSEFAKNAQYSWKTNMLDYIEEAIYNGSLNLTADYNMFKHEELVEKNVGKASTFVAPQGDEKIEDIIRKAESYVYPYEESTKLSSSYSVTALNTGFEEESSTASIYQYASKAGTLYHKVMENINFNARSIKDINKELDRMVEGGIIEKANRTLIDVHNLYRVMNSKTIKEACKGRCMREYKFTMYTPANTVIDGATTDDKVLVQGMLDMVYELNGELTLVDYKLSSKTGEELKNNYKKQLYLYKKAFESAFKRKIDHLGILSLITGEYTNID